MLEVTIYLSVFLSMKAIILLYLRRLDARDNYLVSICLSIHEGYDTVVPSWRLDARDNYLVSICLSFHEGYDTVVPRGEWMLEVTIYLSSIYNSFNP